MNLQMHMRTYLVTLLQKWKLMEKTVNVVGFLQDGLPSHCECLIHQISNNLLVMVCFREFNVKHTKVSLERHIFSWTFPFQLVFSETPWTTKQLWPSSRSSSPPKEMHSIHCVE